MQKEIETRFLDINKDQLAQRLASLGATDKGEEKLEEIILKQENNREGESLSVGILISS